MRLPPMVILVWLCIGNQTSFAQSIGTLGLPEFHGIRASGSLGITTGDSNAGTPRGAQIELLYSASAWRPLNLLKLRPEISIGYGQEDNYKVVDREEGPGGNTRIAIFEGGVRGIPFVSLYLSMERDCARTTNPQRKRWRCFHEAVPQLFFGIHTGLVQLQNFEFRTGDSRFDVKHLTYDLGAELGVYWEPLRMFASARYSRRRFRAIDIDDAMPKTSRTSLDLSGWNVTLGFKIPLAGNAEAKARGKAKALHARASLLSKSTVKISPPERENPPSRVSAVGSRRETSAGMARHRHSSPPTSKAVGTPESAKVVSFSEWFRLRFSECEDSYSNVVIGDVGFFETSKELSDSAWISRCENLIKEAEEKLLE